MWTQLLNICSLKICGSLKYRYDYSKVPESLHNNNLDFCELDICALVGGPNVRKNRGFGYAFRAFGTKIMD